MRSLKLKMISRSRRGRPVQAQKASARVRRGVSCGSATAKSGSTSTSGVSQESQPSSTTVAAMVLVIDLVTEPIIIRVSGGDGVGAAKRSDAKALRVDDLASLDDGHGGAGDPEPVDGLGDVALERRPSLTRQWQRRDTSEVCGRRGWRDSEGGGRECRTGVSTWAITAGLPTASTRSTARITGMRSIGFLPSDSGVRSGLGSRPGVPEAPTIPDAPASTPRPEATRNE